MLRAWRDDGLVGREQNDAGALQVVLNLGAVVGPSFDLLADDGIEATVGRCRFGEQVLDTAVTRNRDREGFMRVATPAEVEVLPAGLDVVGVRDDHTPSGKRGARVVQLPGE